jgi:hypothetical protein
LSLRNRYETPSSRCPRWKTVTEALSDMRQLHTGAFQQGDERMRG